MLAHLVERCGGLERGIAAYNRGSCGRVSRWAAWVMVRANRLRRDAGLPPLRGLPGRPVG
jgi:hypothetical protein